MRRAFAHASFVLIAAVVASVFTFLVSFYVQVAFWGERALKNDAGPQFGVIVLAGFLAILVGALTLVALRRAKER